MSWLRTFARGQSINSISLDCTRHLKHQIRTTSVTQSDGVIHSDCAVLATCFTTWLSAEDDTGKILLAWHKQTALTWGWLLTSASTLAGSFKLFSPVRVFGLTAASYALFAVWLRLILTAVSPTRQRRFVKPVLCVSTHDILLTYNICPSLLMAANQIQCAHLW